ncbi:hypothetical protein GJ496_006200 [Pomphorhynchus laevis]|nr:hypothetical protein GJ496_006200 [Pomphorhynchus laevis]
MKHNNGIVVPVATTNIPCKVVEGNYFKRHHKQQSINQSSEDDDHESKKHKGKSVESHATMLAQMAILEKLKDDLCREEAKLIILKKLRSSQIRRSMTVAANDNRTRTARKPTNSSANICAGISLPNQVVTQHQFDNHCLKSSQSTQHHRCGQQHPVHQHQDRSQLLNSNANNNNKPKYSRGQYKSSSKQIVNHMPPVGDGHSRTDDVTHAIQQQPVGGNYRGNRNRLGISAAQNVNAMQTNFASNQGGPYHPSFMINHQPHHQPPVATGSHMQSSNYTKSTAMSNASADRNHWPVNANVRSPAIPNQNNRVRPVNLTNANHNKAGANFCAASSITQVKDLVAQRKSVLRQNLQKSVDSFLYTLRLHKEISSSYNPSSNNITTFLPTNPVNFVPCHINHEFTMLLGLEEVCKSIQNRMSSNEKQQNTQPISDQPTVDAHISPVAADNTIEWENIKSELAGTKNEISLSTTKDQSLASVNQCSKCSTYCAPYFFHFADQEDGKAVANCGNCLRLLRIDQLSKNQLKTFDLILDDYKKQEEQHIETMSDQQCHHNQKMQSPMTVGCRTNDQHQDFKMPSSPATTAAISNYSINNDQSKMQHQLNAMCNPLASEQQLRLYHAQWMRQQAALFNSTATGVNISAANSCGSQFPATSPSPFFTDAVATAAALAAMSAASQQSIMNVIQPSPPMFPASAAASLYASSAVNSGPSCSSTIQHFDGNSTNQQQTTEETEDDPLVLNLTVKSETKEQSVPVRTFKP